MNSRECPPRHPRPRRASECASDGTDRDQPGPEFQPHRVRDMAGGARCRPGHRGWRISCLCRGETNLWSDSGADVRFAQVPRRSDARVGRRLCVLHPGTGCPRTIACARPTLVGLAGNGIVALLLVAGAHAGGSGPEGGLTLPTDFAAHPRLKPCSRAVVERLCEGLTPGHPDRVTALDALVHCLPRERPDPRRDCCDRA